MTEPIITSVIIPVHNGQETISKCIDSIKCAKNTEIIIIDDGSTDKTKEIVESYKKEKVRYYFQSNRGVSAARNLGIKKAKGEYIMFADADDTYCHDMINTMLKTIKTNKTDIVKCSINKIYNNKEAPVAFPKHISNRTIDTSTTNGKNSFFNLHFRENAVSMCLVMTLLIRKNILRKNNVVFNEKLYMMEDVEFFAKLCNLGPKVYYLDLPLYNYSINDNSTTHARNNYEKMLRGVLLANKAIIDTLGDDASINNKHFKIAFYYLAKGNICNDKYLADLKQLLERCNFNNANRYWKLVRTAYLHNMRILKRILCNIYAIKNRLGEGR